VATKTTKRPGSAQAATSAAAVAALFGGGRGAKSAAVKKITATPQERREVPGVIGLVDLASIRVRRCGGHKPQPISAVPGSWGRDVYEARVNGHENRVTLVIGKFTEGYRLARTALVPYIVRV
jgi:hypothetical protein